MKPVIVYLEIRSWVGMSIGATHTYGQLRTKRSGDLPTDAIDVQRPMSKKEAAQYNREQADQNLGFLKKKPGDLTTGLTDEGDLISTALLMAEKLWGKNVWLIKGDHCTCSAMPIIAWPDEFQKEALRSNELAEEWHRIGGYEGDDDRATAIDKEWYAIHQKVEASAKLTMPTTDQATPGESRGVASHPPQPPSSTPE